MDANQKWGWALLLVGIIALFSVPASGYFLVALCWIVLICGVYLLMIRLCEEPGMKTYDEWEEETKERATNE